jgi:hypothetical protein
MVNSPDSSASMTAAQMADIVGRILTRHGREVLEDRRRVLGLLRDHAPGETRAVRLLMSAYDLDVPKHLAAESGTPNQFKIEHEVNALVADTGLQADLARWAVEVWSAALSGSVPSSVPTPVAIAAGTAAVLATTAAAAAPVAPPPQAAPSAAVAPTADDLTWGDDVPVALAAAPNAPAYAPPPPAPAYAPPYAQPQPAYPPGTVAPGAMPKSPLVRYGVTGAVIVAAILGIKAYMDSQDSAPLVETPAQPAAPAQPARPATPTQPSVTIASTATDSAQWPVFSGASHPNNNAKAWQFQANLRFADNRVFAYNVFVTLNADLQSGTGSMRAIDYRYLAADKADMVSSTPSLPVTRQYEASSKFYFTRLYSTSWTQNPSLAPNICMVFSSGSQAQSFAPEQGIFCAFELQGNTCGSQTIGCGKFE